MTSRAVPVAVPLRADPVLPPRLTYGRLPLSADEGDIGLPGAIYFPLADQDGGLGRVTFEGLDAIRGARGELHPYEVTATDIGASWVYEVTDSLWLAERHDYEMRHYQTPLVSSYDHYLFTFHDEFIEAIAKGIWLDQPTAGHPMRRPEQHPLAEFPLSLAAESHVSRSGIHWELRRNPRSAEDLVRASTLCSQRLYQFNAILDGQSAPGAGVFLRTRRGKTRSQMTRTWVGVVAERDGFADAGEFFAPWEEHLADVAQRRRAMGKPLTE